MRFSAPLAEYKACGLCGNTWPVVGRGSQLSVADHDLARAITGNNVSRIVGQPKTRESLRQRRLLRSNLLRIRAVVRSGGGRSLTGHSIMDALRGSAKRNLSEDLGIAMATSFLTKIHFCQEHYNLDVGINKRKFGIPSMQRPDIGSLTPAGRHVLTEAKGRKNLLELAPQPLKNDPAELVRLVAIQKIQREDRSAAASELPCSRVERAALRSRDTMTDEIRGNVS